MKFAKLPLIAAGATTLAPKEDETMRMLKQAMAVLGTIVVIGMIAALLTPKAVHAIAAALVQVTNTAANPVPTLDISHTAAQIIELRCDSRTAVCAELAPVLGNDGQQYTVPAGMNLLITQADLINFGAEFDTIYIDQFLPPAPESGFINGAAIDVPGDSLTHQYQFSPGIVEPPNSTPTAFSGRSYSDFIVLRGYLAPA